MDGEVKSWCDLFCFFDWAIQVWVENQTSFDGNSKWWKANNWATHNLFKIVQDIYNSQIEIQSF